MATPIIRSNGSISGQVTGQGRNNLVIGEVVTLTDTAVANVGLPYAWLIVDRPVGSSAVLTNPVTATSTFIPDVTGSYRVRCTVNGVDISVVIIAIPLAITGGRIPSFDETLEYNASGNAKGWHTDLTAFMRQADVLIGAASSDEMVKVSAMDITPGRLQSKLTVANGSGLTATVLNPNGNEVLQLDTSTAVREHFSKTSVTDTTPAHLGAKVVAGSNVTVTILNPGGNETVSISAGTNDPNAIHGNVAAEINAVTVKATPVNADLLLIEDSDAGNAKKKVTIGSLPGGTDTDAIHKSTANEISSLLLKVSPSGADIIVIEDASVGFIKKKITLSTLPTDPTAVHSNVANEISALSDKAVPVATDLFLIEDSATGFTKKKVAFSVFGNGTDVDAVHVNVAGEIAALTTVTVASGDFFLIEDVSDSNNKKKILASDLLAGSTDVNAVHVNAANEISGLTSKAVPIGADLLIIEDSAASNVKKKILISSLPLIPDPNALHSNVAGEIAALTTVTAAAGDLVLIEDVSDSNNKKKLLVSDLRNDTTALHSNVAGEIAALTTATAASGDFVLIEDISDSNNKKKVLVSDLQGSGTDVNAVHVNVAGEIALLTTVTVDAGDFILIEDISNANAKRKILASDLISGSGIGASTEKLITPVLIALHESTDASLETVVGSFYFNPSEYSLSGTTRSIVFQVVASVGNATVTGHVRLRDVTTGVNICTFDLTGAGHTTATKFTQVLTVGTPAANVIANSEKLYELRLYVISPALSTDFIENWKSEIIVTNTVI